MSAPSKRAPVEGDMVCIMYVMPPQKLPRTMTARFLAREHVGGRDSYVISGRPLFGTSDIPVEHVQRIDIVNPATSPSRPRVVR